MNKKDLVCNCPECLKGNYNPASYKVDIADFKRERPVGVSGLMRVKNEAPWVGQSIDSCIDSLDELIICYQDCTDNTPEIIEAKMSQYPGKIRVYFYAPMIYAHDLSDENFDYAYNLPKDSIHLLSNYYNYTLSKATYKYAVKIDADQIYFKERLIDLFNAYRFVAKKEYYLYTVRYCFMLSLSVFLPKLFPMLLDILPFNERIMKIYWKCLCKQISRTKQPTALFGINLCKKSGIWWLPKLENKENTSLLFNGSGDLCVFDVSDKTFYVPRYETNKLEKLANDIYFNPIYDTPRIIESFRRDRLPLLHAGFCWYHMKFVNRDESKELYVAGHPVKGCVDFNTFTKFTLKDLKRRNLLNPKKYGFKPHLFFFAVDRNLPDPNDVYKE